MDFVDAFVNAPSAKSRAKANRWLDPSADPLAQQALVDAGILKAKALADANAQKQKEEADAAAALLAQLQKEKEEADAAALLLLQNNGNSDPTSTQTLEDFAAFEKRFEGLAGLDDLKASIEAGTYSGAALEDISASFFNDMVKDASGMLPGGWSSEAGFYSSGADDYVETYLTEPENNPQNENGNFRFVQRTLLDGRTVWEENTNYVPDDATGPGSKKSIERTNQLTESMRLEELAARGVENATSILTRLVGAFGLPVSVVGKLKKFMVDGLGEEAIALEVRQTEEYKTRFPGMALRRDNGFGSITEAQYMQNEDDYEALLRTHGLPPRFYDDRMDFATLIAADVSPNEFNERVTLAELATAGADPNTKAELKRLYDVDPADLVAYYLDPESATNLIEERRSLEAAGLSATAARVMGKTVGFDRQTATALQREGIQRREIQQRLVSQAGLTGQTIGEQDALSVSDVASAEFGLDPNVADTVGRRREERVAGSAGRSGLLVSGTGASGFGTST